MTNTDLESIKYTSDFFGTDLTEFIKACNSLDGSFFYSLNCYVPKNSQEFESVINFLLLAKATDANNAKIHQIEYGELTNLDKHTTEFG